MPRSTLLLAIPPTGPVVTEDFDKPTEISNSVTVTVRGRQHLYLVRDVWFQGGGKKAVRAHPTLPDQNIVWTFLGTAALVDICHLGSTLFPAAVNDSRFEPPARESRPSRIVVRPQRIGARLGSLSKFNYFPAFGVEHHSQSHRCSRDERYVKDMTETHLLDANIAPDEPEHPWPAVGIKSGFPINHGDEKGMHDNKGYIRMLFVGGRWAIWSFGRINRGLALAGVLLGAWNSGTRGKGEMNDDLR